MKTRICPRCGNEYMDFPAISRRDNKTEICATCAQAEALLRMVGQEDKKWVIEPESKKEEK